MSIKIKYEKFDPLSVKVVGKKKVEIQFFDMDLPTRKQTNDDSNLPHQDLLNVIADFGQEQAQALGILDGWDCARDNIKGDLDATKIARDGYETAVLNCDVDSISFHGELRQSIQLAGKVTTKTGSKKQTTPHISLDPEKNEHAKDTLIKVDGLKKELWAYLFGDKFIKSEKKKKADADLKATEQFENAIDNGGEFAPAE